MSSNSHSHGALTTVAATAVITFAGVGSGLAAARTLGPAGRGELAALTLWSSTIVYALSFGLNEATGYFAAWVGPERRAAVFASGQLLALVWAVMAIAMTWLAGTLHLAPWPAGIAPLIVPYMAAYAIPCLTSLAAVAFLQGTGQMRGFNIARTSVHVVTLGAMVACLALGLRSVWAFALATLAGNSVTWFAARAALRQPWAGARVDLALVKQMVSYGLRVQFGSWSAMANLRLDQVVLASLVTFASLGLYVVAVSYATTITIVASALSMVMLPTIAKAEHLVGRAEGFVRLLRWGVWGSLAGGAVLGIIAPKAIAILFGKEYSDARALLVVLIPASLVLALNQLVGSGLRALGKPGAASTGDVLGLVVTVLGLTLLVPRFGVAGAAWTSLIAYTTTAVYMFAHIRRELVFSLRDLWRPSRQEVETIKGFVSTALAR